MILTLPENLCAAHSVRLKFPEGVYRVDSLPDAAGRCLEIFLQRDAEGKYRFGPKPAEGLVDYAQKLLQWGIEQSHAALAQQARKGDAEAAMTLLGLRRSYAQEGFEILTISTLELE